MNTLAAILTGITVAIVVGSAPTGGVDLQSAPTAGVAAAAQYAAVQSGIDEAGR